MQIQKLYECFNDSNALNELCISDLNKLVSETPYFQPAWMLLAKSRRLTGSADYNKVLSQTAARVCNREQLFDFIYSQSETAYEGSKDAKESSKEVIRETAQKNVIAKSDADSSNKKISVAEIPIPPQPIKKENGDEVKSKEDLRSLVKERLAVVDIEKNQNKETNKSTDKEKSKGVPLKSKIDIIDSFIKQRPGINKPKDVDYKEEIEVAARSLDEKFDFVSETLAEINWKQGHAEKAIKIYQKLSLKYPEKSSYFAAQIKKINLSK